MHFGLFSLMAQHDRLLSPRPLYQEMVGKEVMPRIDHAIRGLRRVGHAA
jgi:hypothetical protein